MKRACSLLTACFCVAMMSANASAAGVTYFSQGSLAPNLTTSWNTLPAGGGLQPPNFTNADIWVIQNGHNMTTSAPWTIGGGQLQIASGGTLTATQAVTINGALFQIDAGGTYVHGNNAVYSSTIFNGTELFNAASTVILNNSNTFGPGGVTFGNLTVNYTTSPGAVNCQGGLTSVAGNFTVINTLGNEFRLSGTTPYTLTVGGNLTVSGGILNLTNGASGGPFTVNVGGNFSQSGGGTFLSSNTANIATVAFSGGAASATFSGGANPTNINWQVASGKTLQLNSSFTVAASRTMTVASGGVLALANAYANQGATTINGEFRIVSGAVSFNNFIYGANATLSFAPAAAFNVPPSPAYWPPANGPANVTVGGGGGVNLGAGVSRTIAGTLTLANGALSIGPNTLTLNGAIDNSGGGTLTGGASSNITFGGSGASTALPAVTLNNLTINRANGITLGGAVTVGGTLALTSGDLTTGAFTLTQGGASTGTADVVGNVRRTDLGASARPFGHPDNQITIQAGTPPTEVTVNLVKSRPTGVGFGFPTAVNRTYTITPTGGGGYTATLRLHYLDTELSGSPPGEEALLDLWRFNGTSWERVPRDVVGGNDVVNNWVQSSNVTQFSPWAISATPLAPTAVSLRETSATSYDGGTVIEWRTGSEVDNLGFRLYREDAGRRTLITPSLVAGSALTTGPRTVLTAGNSYTWIDRAGTPASRYWLEDVDTNGRGRMHGPFWGVAAAGARMPQSHQSLLLSQLGAQNGARGTQRQWAPAAGASQGVTTQSLTLQGVNTQGLSAQGMSVQGLSAQRAVAAPVRLMPPTNLGSREAVKLTVRRAGWYRVTRAQLEAAGLSASADPARLQLFVEGYEQAVRLDARAWPQNGAVEFYGEGADRPATDARVYWLIEGTTQGRRIASPVGGVAPPVPPRPTRGALSAAPIIIGGGGAPSPTGFDYTTERRDRTIYFAGLLNGERSNFFGGVVGSAAAPQVVTVRDIEARTAGQARLEVALQGLTAGPHVVRVALNGTELGTLNFAGRESKAASFPVSPRSLREGDNEVGLTSSAPSDVSLTDYVRLTYRRAYRAEADRLSFTAPGGVPVQITGFTSAGARVVDITDPSNPAELAVVFSVGDPGNGGYAVTVRPNGTGQRRLLAFTPASTEQASGVAANRPSSLRDAQNGADFVVITHGDFRAAADALAARRASEGLAAVVVDVEDVYDEFSSGAHSPAALRDFLALAHSAWGRRPRYVLLVGDGSYDPRGHLGRGSWDFVPAPLVDTDYMETASDDWFADFDGDGLAEMAVGRLPVRTSAEAERVVAKIMGHTPGGARRAALTVADRAGADGYSFESALAGVESLLPEGFAVRRVNRGARPAPEVRAEITARINDGPALVNYMGHGSVGVWTGEGILRGADAAALANGTRLPLFVLMTCLNGYYIDPTLDGLAEQLLKAEHGGALAAWASTGMTTPDAQTEMNRALLRQLFGPEPLTLGEAARRAKASAADLQVRRTWVFLGDPTSRW